MSDRRHVTLRVVGIVQGVNYRQAARREAQRLGISGFARNEPDGSVTVEAEGEPGDLDEFVAWCRHGPNDAQVAGVTVASSQVVGYDGFARR